MNKRAGRRLRWRCAVCALLCLLCVSARVSAQAEKDDPAQDFAEAVRLYAADFDRLLHSRGLPSVAALQEARRKNGLLFFPYNLDKYSDRFVAAELHDNFPPGTAVLFYFYTGDELYTWLIDQAGIQGYHHARRTQAELDEAMAQLRRALDVDSVAESRAPRLRGIGNAVPPRPALRPALRLAQTQLSALLLPPPVARALAPVKHLVVVPVLNIGTVPYALLRPSPTSTELIEQMTISVAPSLFDLELPVEKWAGNFQRPLVVGNPYLPPADDWLFPPLPGAEQEANAVARQLKTTPLVGSAATKQTVIARAQNADLLYFATHGLASDRDPLNNGFLALAGPTSLAGRWLVREVQDAKLPARLAVLSACQTGLGRTETAGVVGLARSFQLAGVPRVVMSLWSVNDEATAELMQNFFAQLQTQPPAAALRQAMLDTRKRHPDPAAWASFVIFGSPR